MFIKEKRPGEEFEMVIGFTMIKVQQGQEIAVFRALLKKPDLRWILRLYGGYSFFLMMECDRLEDLSELVKDVLNTDFVSKIGPLMSTSEADAIELAEILSEPAYG